MRPERAWWASSEATAVSALPRSARRPRGQAGGTVELEGHGDSRGAGALLTHAQAYCLASGVPLPPCRKFTSGPTAETIGGNGFDGQEERGR